MPRCHVHGCRFADSHVTAAHRCTTCGAYGHGQVECADHVRRQALSVHLADEMPPHLRCAVDGCTHAWTHATAAHHCSRCSERGGAHHRWCALYSSTGESEDESVDESVDEDEDESVGELSDEDEAAHGLSLSRRCPTCREESDVPTKPPSVFVNTEECVVCMQYVPKLVVLTCGHLVCAECTKRL